MGAIELCRERRAYKKENSSRSQCTKKVKERNLLIVVVIKELKNCYSIEEYVAKGASSAQRRSSASCMA